MIRCLAVGLLLLWGIPSAAQHADHAPEDCPMKAPPGTPSPYAGLERREIKALSEADREKLLSGHGMGMALAAELNRYPGPKHVLELAVELKLDDGQIRSTREIFHEMDAAAKELGREVLAREAELDRRFHAAEVDEDGLHTMVVELGRLRGELRWTHLRAHVRMRELMSDEQVAAYDRLRGYRHDSPPGAR